MASIAFLRIFSITHSKSAGLTGTITSLPGSKPEMKFTFEEVLDLRYSIDRIRMAAMFSGFNAGFDPILENLSVTFSRRLTSSSSSLVMSISGYLF